MTMNQMSIRYPVLDQVLRDDTIVKKMIEITRLRRPIVEAFDEQLASKFGSKAKTKGVKLNVGRIAKLIMAKEGYVILEQHVPVRSNVFRESLVYQKKP